MIDRNTFAELPRLKSLAKRRSTIRIEFRFLPNFSLIALYKHSSSSLHDDFSKSLNSGMFLLHQICIRLLKDCLPLTKVSLSVTIVLNSLYNVIHANGFIFISNRTVVELSVHLAFLYDLLPLP